MITKEVKIGRVIVGGANKIRVQSMTTTDTKDIDATISQIKGLERVGCEIIRVSVPNIESAKAIPYIKEGIAIPLVADIHFNHKMATESIKQGADKIRINPGNMQKKYLDYLIDLAKERGVPIRIGVNSGSLKEATHRSSHGKAKLMVDKALSYLAYFEKRAFDKLIVSLKSSDVLTSIEAYTRFSSLSNYPTHLGITEAGTNFGGLIKSSVGLGILLFKGIGSTIRVSLSADPKEEVIAGYKILQSLGFRSKYPEIISCPTCSRAGIDVISLANEVEDLIYAQDYSRLSSGIKIAVMGCIVNGPGEAKEADLGVCGTGDKVAFFKGGKVVKTINKADLGENFNTYVRELI